MQWFKGRSSFIIGSDRWMGGQNSSNGNSSSQQTDLPSPAPPSGSGSFRKEAGSNPADQADTPTSIYPPVSKYDPLSGLRVRSPRRDEILDKATASPSKLYPNVYEPSPEETANTTTTAPLPEVVETSQETLVKIPQSMVHLVDNEESVVLASGDFLMVKLLQNGNGVALFAKVGDELQWPIVKDLPVTKLDPSHYVFSIRVDYDEEEPTKHSSNKTQETLNYGVTFKVDGNKPLLQKLDDLLDQYSYFSAPTMLQASEEDIKKLEDSEVASKDVPNSQLQIPGKPVHTDALADQKPSEELSTAYWTTIAPNVDDYNSSLARAIASGTGHIIRGIFWCSDTTVSNLERGGRLVRRVSGVCKKPSEIHPRTLRNIRRAKRVTKMSEKVAKGVLTGVVSVTGFFTNSFVNSSVGKKFFKMLPGEVALASLDGFGKIFDAIEVAGSNVMNTTSVVTTGAVSHRYGDKAGELTQEGLATAGHLFTAAWTISKLRNAINPKNVIKPTAVLKQAARTTSQNMKKK